jgi:hypothetical protein
MIEAKAFRTFVRIYSLFKSERLSGNVKLTFHKALIRSVMTNACLARELAADTRLLKSERLQNEVLRIVENFSRRISIREMHVVVQMSHIRDYITKLCRQLPELTHTITKMHMFATSEQMKPHKRLKLGGGQVYDRSNDQVAVVT